MFGLFKGKKEMLISPADGDIVALSEVPDEVFSQKMAGDGIALMPRSNTFIAPVAGVVSKIFASNHAFSIQTKTGLEVMVHIGLDTVELQGKGFKQLAQEGETVSAGQPIVAADLDFIESQGKAIITPIVMNHEKNLELLLLAAPVVREGDSLLEVTIK